MSVSWWCPLTWLHTPRLRIGVAIALCLPQLFATSNGSSSLALCCQLYMSPHSLWQGRGTEDLAHWIVSLLRPPITNVTGFSGAAGWVPGARLSWRQPLWRKSHGRCSGRYVPHHRKDTEIPPEESWTRSTSACASWRLRILPGLRSRLLTPRAILFLHGDLPRSLAVWQSLPPGVRVSKPQPWPEPWCHLHLYGPKAKNGCYKFKSLDKNQKKNDSLHIKMMENSKLYVHTQSVIGIQPCALFNTVFVALSTL